MGPATATIRATATPRLITMVMGLFTPTGLIGAKQCRCRCDDRLWPSRSIYITPWLASNIVTCMPAPDQSSYHSSRQPRYPNEKTLRVQRALYSRHDCSHRYAGDFINFLVRKIA